MTLGAMAGIKRCTIALAAVLSLVLLTPLLSAAEPPDIQQTYSTLCGGCHGDDGRGTQQGPGLAGNPSVRARSVQSLRNVIRNGIPAAGCPPSISRPTRSMLSQR